MPRTSKNWTPEMRAAQSKRLKAFWDAKKAAKAGTMEKPVQPQINWFYTFLNKIGLMCK
jgi:hypothetical protein